MQVASPSLLWVVAIGCPIVAIAPFDLSFAALTFGSPIARVVLVACIAWIGWQAGLRCGMYLEAHGSKRPLLVGIAAALGVAVYVVLLDCYLFRPLLRPEIVDVIELPLYARLIGFMARAFLENIIYRLFAFSVLVFALTRLRIASGPAIAAAMVLAQLANIGVNVTMVEHVTAPVMFYDAIRYVAPGVLWAWIYRRFGFVTSEVASVGCHAFLQPAFSILFT